MRSANLDRALEAMLHMEKGRPYSLSHEDRKRRLLDELSRLTSQLGLSPVVIGGLAVSHHGYVRTTQDVDLLLTREEGTLLFKKLKDELGWKRHAEGFRNTVLDVGLDLCLEGQRTSPRWNERFPSPEAVRSIRVDPLPVISLEDLIALKTMSARGKDDADVIELLKKHRRRIPSLAAAARRRLATPEARTHLEELVSRARSELDWQA